MSCKDCIYCSACMHYSACMHTRTATLDPYQSRPSDKDTEECSDWKDRYTGTNRAWLESLTNRQLADFLTHGLILRLKAEPASIDCHSIKDILWRNTKSDEAVTNWLSQNQEYEVITK